MGKEGAEPVSGYAIALRWQRPSSPSEPWGLSVTSIEAADSGIAAIRSRG